MKHFSADRSSPSSGIPGRTPVWWRLWSYIWSSPVSLVGLLLALLAIVTGGSARWTNGTLEVTGGCLSSLLAKILPGFPIGAITLGYVILAVDHYTMEACRTHEYIHVRQFARWGLLFPMLYGISSLVAALRRQHIYHCNRYEKEARARSGYPPERQL